MRCYYDRVMSTRADRPVSRERQRRIDGFVQACQDVGVASVVEVGCGDGRDGSVFGRSGLDYVGLDSSSAATELCKNRGLSAVQGVATALPFPDRRFDAGWSMSTLMHLRDDGFEVALRELHRVLRTGAVAAVGLWGAIEEQQSIDEHGRFFYRRTDHDVQSKIATIGHIIEFDTWDRREDGGHYQWTKFIIN